MIFLQPVSNVLTVCSRLSPNSSGLTPSGEVYGMQPTLSEAGASLLSGDTEEQSKQAKGNDLSNHNSLTVAIKPFFLPIVPP